jgi:hypothetical protein
VRAGGEGEKRRRSVTDDKGRPRSRTPGLAAHGRVVRSVFSINWLARWV